MMALYHHHFKKKIMKSSNLSGGGDEGCSHTVNRTRLRERESERKISMAAIKTTLYSPAGPQKNPSQPSALVAQLLTPNAF